MLKLCVFVTVVPVILYDSMLAFIERGISHVVDFFS